MDKKFALPRGTADILPGDILAWETLEQHSRRILKSYGYREIRTPMYEDINLFVRSLGQTSDVVNKQLLHVVSHADMQPGADQKSSSLALRPEGTAAVVRSYVENDCDKKEPLSKFFYIGPMFRGERPQKGRLRQFHQIGVEAIGPNSVSPLLDAEILALAMHLLQDLGVPGAKLKINTLGSQADKEHVSSWLRVEFGKVKNDLCDDCRDRFERNVFRVLDCKNDACRKVVSKVLGEQKALPLSDASRAYFTAVQDALKSLEIPYEVAPHLVRGLDYYTHTVFEITAPGLGSQDAVGAGGRYSGLIHELGGNPKVDFGAVGFALGMERILLATSKAAGAQIPLDAFVVAMDAQHQPQAFLLVSRLRKAGLSADMSFTGGSIKSQMGRADKLNAHFALILGEQEIKDCTVTVKDMFKGEQEIVQINSVIAKLKGEAIKL